MRVPIESRAHVHPPKLESCWVPVGTSKWRHNRFQECGRGLQLTTAKRAAVLLTRQRYRECLAESARRPRHLSLSPVCRLGHTHSHCFCHPHVPSKAVRGGTSLRFTLGDLVRFALSIPFYCTRATASTAMRNIPPFVITVGSWGFRDHEGLHVPHLRRSSFDMYLADPRPFTHPVTPWKLGT